MTENIKVGTLHATSLQGLVVCNVPSTVVHDNILKSDPIK